MWFWIVDNLLMSAETMEVGDEEFEDALHQHGAIAMDDLASPSTEIRLEDESDEWDEAADTELLIRRR